MNVRAVLSFVETKIRVASKHAFGVHLSGCVKARMSSHCGSVGMILKGFGSFPDLYLDRIIPILGIVSVLSLPMKERLHIL